METGFTQSVNGLTQAFADHSARAGRIAKAAENEDLAKDLAGQTQDTAMAKANLEMIKTHDRMLGEILDIFA